MKGMLSTISGHASLNISSERSRSTINSEGFITGDLQRSISSGVLSALHITSGN